MKQWEVRIEVVVANVESTYKYTNTPSKTSFTHFPKRTRMNVLLYRRLYLSQNWGSNHFIQLKHKVVGFKRLQTWYPNIRTFDKIKNHPLVTSGRAYWINNNELCMGYQLRTNPNVFRPIFSEKRQRLLKVVHADIIRPTKFWHAVRVRYWHTTCQLKQLPLECVECIVRFIY